MVQTVKNQKTSVTFRGFGVLLNAEKPFSLTFTKMVKVHIKLTYFDLNFSK